MGTHNIYFHGEIRKRSVLIGRKKRLIWSYEIRVFLIYTHTLCLNLKLALYKLVSYHMFPK